VRAHNLRRLEASSTNETSRSPGIALNKADTNLSAQVRVVLSIEAGVTDAIKDSLTCDFAEKATKVSVHGAMRVNAEGGEVSTFESGNRGGDRLALVILLGIAVDLHTLRTFGHLAPVLLLLNVRGRTRVANSDISEMSAFHEGLAAVRAKAFAASVT